MSASRSNRFWAGGVALLILSTITISAFPAAADDIAGAWTPACLAECPHPSGRADASMAFDPSSETVVMFGGHAYSSSETWLWFGGRWAQVAPPISPNGVGVAMAYDEDAGNIVLLDGAGQTWLWEGIAKRWNKQITATSPPAFYPWYDSRRLMAYDPSGRNVVMVDGQAGQTWTWGGSPRGWTRQAPALSPFSYGSTLTGTSLAYDPTTGNVLLFYGGASWTWVWALKNWTRLSPLLSPHSRGGPSMTNQNQLGGTLLFGGRNFVPYPQTGFGGGGEGAGLSDAWIWDGRLSTWVPQTSGPPDRSSAAITYDPIRRQAVMFGGLGNSIALGSPWTPGSRPCLSCLSVVSSRLLDDTWTFGAQIAPLPGPTPDAPTNLTVASGNGFLRLNWGAPADNGSAITNYQVYRGTSSGTHTLVATIGKQTTYDDSSVASGNTYFYKVAAMSSRGEGQKSNETNAKTVAPGSVEGKVTNQATKKGVSGASVDCGNGGRATTAVDGTYSIANVPPATYMCTASASGFQSLDKSVTVNSNSVTTVHFPLKK